MIGMIQNITEFKNLEMSLQNAIEELKEVNSRKNDFLAILGHELRNPLAAISGGVDFIKLGEENQEQITEMLGRNVKIMSSMLDDLLDLSRIDSGSIKLDQSVFEMKGLVQSTVFEFKPLFASKNQQIKLKVAKGNTLIKGDPIRLEQVISNLLTNAQKFTPENGEVEVSVEGKDQRLYVKIKDNGIGLEGEDLTIFEPFSQVNPSKGNKGLGIGLALVKRFTEMHEGEVMVESEGENKGSLFTLSFPLVEPKEQAGEPKENVKKNSVLKDGLRVMIVDDNTDANTLLKIGLEKRKCKVVSAFDASQALGLLKDVAPEVFILDIGLPDMDGHNLLKEIKKVFKEPALYIAHTGYGHQEAREKTEQSGFDYHITKPLEMAKLLEILASVD